MSEINGLAVAQTAITGIGQFLATSMTSAFKTIQKVATVSLGPVGFLINLMSKIGAFNAPMEALMEPLEMFGDIIGNALLPAVQPIVDALYQFTPLIEELGLMIASFLGPAIKDLLPPVMQIVMALAQAFLPILQSVFTMLQPLIPVLVGMANAIAYIAPAIMGAVSAVFGFFTNIGTTIVGYIVTGWNAVTDFFSNLGTSVWTNIKNGFGIVIDFFAGIPKMILDAIKGAMLNFGEDIKDWWSGLWD